MQILCAAALRLIGICQLVHLFWMTLFNLIAASGNFSSDTAALSITFLFQLPYLVFGLLFTFAPALVLRVARFDRAFSEENIAALSSETLWVGLRFIVTFTGLLLFARSVINLNVWAFLGNLLEGDLEPIEFWIARVLSLALAVFLMIRPDLCGRLIVKGLVVKKSH